MDFTRSMITDVVHAYGYDKTTGKLIFMSKNLVNGGVKNTLSSEEVRNGRQNALFTLLYSDKGAEITLTENTFNFAEVAVMAGTEIAIGAGVGYSEEKTYVADATKAITLSPTPKTGAVLNCYVNGKEITGTLVGGKVTFTTGVSENDIVTVYPYLIETSATTETITINMNDEPKAIKLVLKTKEVSASKKVVADIELIFDNVITTGEWEINTQSKVQASEQPITLKVLQSDEDSERLYKVNRIPRV